MTTVEQRDFSSFELGDNVYKLAGGLIPEIAESLEVSLGGEPNSDDLQSIMEKVGPNKVLRDNAEIQAIDRDSMVELIERSGIQAPLSRSLWTPDVPAVWDTVDAMVLVGAVANWQDRAVNAALVDELRNKPVYVLGGTRLMDTATEKPNSNIDRLHEKFRRYPTEAEYAASVVTPRLVAAGRNVLATPFNTADGDTILDTFFETNPDLLEASIAVVRVANAGVLMALQMRAAAQKHSPAFDTNPEVPQTFIITDTLPVARTDDEEKDAANYQKSATALRQVVLTAKKLYEATTTLIVE
jgi:hypothetical protein